MNFELEFFLKCRKKLGRLKYRIYKQAGETTWERFFADKEGCRET